MTSIGSAGPESKLDPPAINSTPAPVSSGSSTINSLPVQVNKNEDKVKFNVFKINDIYIGKSLETQKTTAPRHGLQTIGKIGSTRRMVPQNLPSLKSLSSSDSVTQASSTCTTSTTTTNASSGSVQSSSNAWPTVSSNSDDTGPATAVAGSTDASEVNCKSVPASNATSPTTGASLNDLTVTTAKSTSSSSAATTSSSSASSSNMVTSITGASSGANIASGLNIHVPAAAASVTDSQPNSSSCSKTVSSANSSFFPPPPSQSDTSAALSAASVTSTSTNQPLSSTTKASFSSSVYRTKKDDTGPSSKFNANIIPSEKIVEFDKMLARETIQTIDWTTCVDEIDYDQDLNFVIDEDSSVSGKRSASGAPGKPTGSSSTTSNPLSNKSQVNVTPSNTNSSSDVLNEATSTSVTTCSSSKVTSSVTSVTAPVLSSTATAPSTTTTTCTTNSSSTAKVNAKRTSSSYEDEYIREPPSSGRVLYDPKKSNGSNAPTSSMKQQQQQGSLPNSVTCQTSNPSGSSDRRTSENQRPRRISRSSIDKYDVNHSSAREGNETSSSSYRSGECRDMGDRDREYPSSSATSGQHSSGPASGDHRTSDKSNIDTSNRAPVRHLNNHGSRDAPRSSDFRHVNDYHRHDRDYRYRNERDRDDRVSSNYDRSSNYIPRSGLSSDTCKDSRGGDRPSHDDRSNNINRDRDRLDHNRDRDSYMRGDRGIRDRNDRDRDRDRDRTDRDSKYRRENQLAPRFQKLQQQQRLQHLNVDSSSSLPSHHDSKLPSRESGEASRTSSAPKRESEGSNATILQNKSRTSTTSTSASSEVTKPQIRTKIDERDRDRDGRTSQRSSTLRSSESSQSSKFGTDQETKGASSDAARASQPVISTNQQSQSKVVTSDSSSRLTHHKSNANNSASGATASSVAASAAATVTATVTAATASVTMTTTSTSDASANKGAVKSGNESNVTKSSSNTSLNQHKNHPQLRQDDISKSMPSGNRSAGSDGKTVFDEKKKQQSSQLTYLPPHSEARREQQRRDSRTSSEKSIDVAARVASSRDHNVTSDPSFNSVDNAKSSDGTSKSSQQRDYVNRGASSSLIESSSRRPIKDQVYKPQGTVIFENKKLREQNAQLDKSAPRNSSNRNVPRLNHMMQDERSLRSAASEQHQPSHSGGNAAGSSGKLSSGMFTGSSNLVNQTTGNMAIASAPSSGGHGVSSIGNTVKSMPSNTSGTQSGQVSQQIIPSQLANNAAASAASSSTGGNSGPSSYDRYDLDFKIASVKKVWDDSTPPSVSTPSSSTPSSIRHSSPSTQVATGQSQGLPGHPATSQFEGHPSGAFSHHSSMVGDENKLVNFSFSNEPIKSKSPRSTMPFNNSTSSKSQLNTQPANVGGGNMVVPPYGGPLSGELLSRQMHKNAMYQQQQQQHQHPQQPATMVRNNLPGSSPPVLLGQVNSPPPLDHPMRHHQAPLTAHNHFMSAAMSSNQVHHTNHAALTSPYSTIYPAYPQQLQTFAQQIANSQLAAQHQHIFQQSQAAAALHHHQQQQQQQQHPNVRNVQAPFGATGNAGDLSHDAYRMSTNNQPAQSTQGPGGALNAPNASVTPSVSAAAALAQQQHQQQLAAFFKQSFMPVQANFNHAVHPLSHHMTQANAAGAHSYGAPGQSLPNPQQAGNPAPAPQAPPAHAPGAIGSYFTPTNSTHVPSASMYHVPPHVAHHPPHQTHAPHPHSHPHPHPHAQFAPATGPASNVAAASHAPSNQVSSVNQPAQSQQQQQQPPPPNQSVASSSQAFRQPVSRNNRNRF